ncbi:hypothetical protein [Rhizobium sp. MHM7A]|uniref:hypothetical protein n=1 Tax=Rhizobium sp. MHM7A TaxID=2583233 RepID=UPI0011073CA8|nr:hypothetical protein [Rhizobium sp. MHM7A]TLX16836.1 hypothetical protein FFR93_05680 [Rhizobium sp. MHM7A]
MRADAVPVFDFNDGVFEQQNGFLHGDALKHLFNQFPTQLRSDSDVLQGFYPAGSSDFLTSF